MDLLRSQLNFGSGDLDLKRHIEHINPLDVLPYIFANHIPRLPYINIMG